MKKNRNFQLILIFLLMVPFLTLSGMENEEERTLMFADEAEYWEKIEQFSEEIQGLFKQKSFLPEYLSLEFVYKEPEIVERTASYLRIKWLLEASVHSKTLQEDFYSELRSILSEYAKIQTSFQASVQTLRDGRYVFSFPDIMEYLRHSDIRTGDDSCWIFVLQGQKEPGAAFEVHAYLMENMKSTLESVLNQYLHDPGVLYRLRFYGEETEEPLREDVIYSRKHPDYRSFSTYELDQGQKLGHDYISIDSINSRQIFHEYHGHYIVMPYLRTNRFFNPHYLFSVFTLISPEEMNTFTEVKPFIAEKPYFEEASVEDIEQIDIEPEETDFEMDEREEMPEITEED